MVPYLDPPKHSTISLKKWNITLRTQIRDIWWKTNIPASYAQLEIKHAPLFPKELLLSRKALGIILAARTGHGDFTAYHTRFNHAEARLTCLCGSPKTPTHFLFCRILRRRRGGLTAGSIDKLLPDLIGTSEGAISMSKWLENSRFFEEICPR